MVRLFTAMLLIVTLLSCNNLNSEKQKITGAIGCYSPPTDDKAWYSSGKKAPKFEGLSGIDFSITTSSHEAQQYFNQGMMLAYGFNHAEAARSFYEATRLDSTCAMAYWGFAYVLGPNYNAGMEEDNYQRAYSAAIKAQSLSKNCTAKETALIEAMVLRYAEHPPADRSGLDIAYCTAMKKVYSRYSSDPDIGALYAESLMNLHPWDLYDKKTKAPRTWTPELIAVLEHLIKINPTHPGAHHFYIHALEASATPEKALASAKLLETLVPGAGHLLHMPSHIYINTGDYHLGSLSNIRAVAADSNYTTTCHAQGAYPLSYFPHNYHFLAATATLEGHSKWAWMAAKQLQEHTSEEVMRMPGWGTLQHYFTIPYYIAVKFSMWDTILTFPASPEDLVYPQAILHYAKGMALLGKNDLTGAQKEMDSLSLLTTDTALQHLTIWEINSTADIVQIAAKVLAAEIASNQGQSDKAVSLLREAIVIEDNLNYNEPPDWFFSVRHHLGNVLLKSGKYNEAEKIFKEDLQTWRKNGWALAGLYNALIKQNKTEDAEKTKKEFDEAWQHADIKIL